MRDERRPDAARPHEAASPARDDRRSEGRDRPDELPDDGAAKKKDPLKVVMPSGESGSRNPPQRRPATATGGTSGAEDSTRTAGYVADLATPPEPPPGPPVAKDPALLTPPEKRPPPPPADAKTSGSEARRGREEKPTDRDPSSPGRDSPRSKGTPSSPTRRPR